MTSLAGTALLVSLWAGLCAADQRALGGRLIHQPLVAAVGTGLLLGCPERALLIGLWFQLVWIAPMPVGGVLVPDSGSASVAAAILAAFFPGETGFVMALVLGLAVARLSIPWERRAREANERREQGALGGAVRSLRRGVLLGVAAPLLRGFSIALLLLIASWWGSRWLAGGSAIAAALDSIHPPLSLALLVGAGACGLFTLYERVAPELGSRKSIYLGFGLILGVALRLAWGG